jgi:hypothetical protein
MEAAFLLKKEIVTRKLTAPTMMMMAKKQGLEETVVLDAGFWREREAKLQQQRRCLPF